MNDVGEPSPVCSGIEEVKRAASLTTKSVKRGRFTYNGRVKRPRFTLPLYSISIGLTTGQGVSYEISGERSIKRKVLRIGQTDFLGRNHPRPLPMGQLC